MSSKSNLYILYHFSSQESEQVASGYHVILMFSENGEVIAKEHPEIFEDSHLIFKTKEDLLELGEKALKTKKFGAVYLLSSSDFNVGIETCHDLSSFREIFKRYGQLVAGNESDQETNIFGKFFGD